MVSLSFRLGIMTGILTDVTSTIRLEDYLQTWPSTLLVVSHDRSFLDAVATDIIHQHNERLDYYKGNFTQFYATKSERAKNQKREYEAQLQYRQHLQAFVDRWRCELPTLAGRCSIWLRVELNLPPHRQRQSCRAGTIASQDPRELARAHAARRRRRGHVQV